MSGISRDAGRASRRLGPLVAALLVSLLAACAGAGTEGGGSDPTDDPASVTTSEEQRYPDIVEVTLEPSGDGLYDVAVTVSSPYDTPGRYADGWRVTAPDGTVLGEHTLAHDHAGEQPFTRTQRGLAIPDGTVEVTVQGRDQEHGFGGDTVTVPVP